MHPTKRYYTKAEVASIVGLAVLVWWEHEIESFTPKRTKGGHRRYTPEDLEMARHI
ncbi:MAG: MerR family transcriptional regulator [Bacteroides sp.]|nr:MerR family transcriptional regulator [Bacteroides sp.]MBD5363892.1 MerR family transcriptional regulator [Bacteroides sp.]MBD5372763.1 MerR family transcriptional regulator [Bacteroides sp.]